MNLYNLTNDMKDLIEMLEEDPENEAVKETIAMLLLDLEDKAEDYVHVIRQLEADAEAAKAEKLRLAKKQSAAENGAKRLRDALKYAMLTTGRTKIKRPTCSMNVSTKWKAFLDVDPRQIPEQFQKVTIEARMQDVEKWLKEFNPEISRNNCIECEWAHLDQVESLTIR